MNIEKSWSIYKFTALANKISSQNKTLFFIEKDKIDLIDKIKISSISNIPSLIQTVFSSSSNGIASRLNTAISIDNGVMHMMALANIPMIVLFGPTDPSKFAPKNKYTKILDSKKFTIQRYKFNRC